LSFKNDLDGCERVDTADVLSRSESGDPGSGGRRAYMCAASWIQIGR
jgi:hypothetical protein